MCDVSKKTGLKEITVYKAVIKYMDNYYSYFAGKLIKVGKVTPLTEEEALFMRYEGCPSARSYVDTEINREHAAEGMNTFNLNIVGKVSGFMNIRHARKLAGGRQWTSTVVLKIVLSGKIMKGTAANITHIIPGGAIVYAGSVVKSFELVK